MPYPPYNPHMQPAQPGQPVQPQQPLQPVQPQQQPGYQVQQPIPQQQAPASAGIDIFAGIDAAQTFQSSTWADPGRYIVRLNQIKKKTTLKQETLIIVEQSVMRALSVAEAHQHGKVGHADGAEISYSYNMRHMSTLGNLKAFVAVLEGLTPDELVQALAKEGRSLSAHMETILGSGQPYAGMFVEVLYTQIATRSGAPFTRANWQRVVPARELQSVLSPETLASFFPGDTLSQIIANEDRIEAAGQGQPAPHQQAAPPVSLPGSSPAPGMPQPGYFPPQQ